MTHTDTYQTMNGSLGLKGPRSIQGGIRMPHITRIGIAKKRSTSNQVPACLALKVGVPTATRVINTRNPSQRKYAMGTWTSAPHHWQRPRAMRAILLHSGHTGTSRRRGLNIRSLNCVRSPYNPHRFSHPSQHFERLLQFFFCVRGGHDGSHARFAFGDGGKCDAGSELSFFEPFAGKIHRKASVANDDWCDRRFARGRCLAADVEAEQAEFFLPEPCVRPELLHPLRLGFQNVESRNAGRRD